MHIREANPNDNQTLQRVMAQCPQGSSLRITTLNTPDFFARAKAYQRHKVFVAENESGVIGSTACAVREVLVNGSLQEVGYEFQLFVAKAYRRQGIARLLMQHDDVYMREQGSVYTTAFIVPGNIQSIRFTESRGFHLHRQLLGVLLLPYTRMALDSRYTIRSATEQDLEPVAQLLNQTWGTANFYRPMTASELSGYIERTAGLSLNQLLLLEEQGKLLACVGIWDWSQIMQITVQSFSLPLRLMAGSLDLLRLLRPMPRMPKVGEAFRQWGLTLLGFHAVEHLNALLREVNNRALEAGIEQIIVGVCERDHAIMQSLKGFIIARSPMNFYVRPLQPGSSIDQRPMFVDMLDF